jgi:predicted GNAT family acetyltransferase
MKRSVTGERPEVVVTDVPEASRYEASVDGRLAGFVEYRLLPDRITFLHTEVDPEFTGGGVGSRLAASVLHDARIRGLGVRPLCPFIAAYIRRHPEHADQVVPVGDDR